MKNKLDYKIKKMKNLTIYQLVGEESKFDRLSLYNSILFENFSKLLNNETVIIMNEKKSGGIIYSNKNIKKYLKNYMDHNQKLIFKYNDVERNSRNIYRISFSCFWRKYEKKEI